MSSSHLTKSDWTSLLLLWGGLFISILVVMQSMNIRGIMKSVISIVLSIRLPISYYDLVFDLAEILIATSLGTRILKDFNWYSEILLRSKNASENSDTTEGNVGNFDSKEE